MSVGVVAFHAGRDVRSPCRDGSFTGTSSRVRAVEGWSLGLTHLAARPRRASMCHKSRPEMAACQRRDRRSWPTAGDAAYGPSSAPIGVPGVRGQRFRGRPSSPPTFPAIHSRAVTGGRHGHHHGIEGGLQEERHGDPVAVLATRRHDHAVQCRDPPSADSMSHQVTEVDDEAAGHGRHGDPRVTEAISRPPGPSPRSSTRTGVAMNGVDAQMS